MGTSSKHGTLGRTRHIALLGLVLLAAGCHKRHKPGGTTSTAATEPAAKTASTGGAEHPAAALAMAEGATPLTVPLLKFLPADGLRGPSSVIHDEVNDVYLLSNVDGPPLAADGKGFISKLAPDGKKVLVRWIESGKNKVVLNAPRGMALRGNELYVADIDKVRVFHRRTGAPVGDVDIPGSKFLDGVTLATDGAILVSDAGMKANARGELEESGTDAVYAIYRDNKSVSVSLRAKQPLVGPRGLATTPKKIWGVEARAGELFSIDAGGKLGDFQKLPHGGLEGIVAVGDDLLVSSREAGAILQGRPNERWRVIIGDVKSPAHIGYDRKRKRVLVPLFTEDEVRVYGY